MYGDLPGVVYIPRKSYTSPEFIIQSLIKFTERTSTKSIITLHTIYYLNVTRSISNNFNIFPFEDT